MATISKHLQFSTYIISSKMYDKGKTLLMATSASAMCNNMAVNNEKNYKTSEFIAVIHQGFINVVPVKQEHTESKYIPCTDVRQHQTAIVTQVMWCTLGNEVVFAVLSTLGLQIFDCDGLECRYSHPCQDPSSHNECFARGLATIYDEFLCVGNSVGCLRLFGLLGEDRSILFVDRKHEHREAIMDLTTNENLIASSDEGGLVVLWILIGEELIKSHELPTYESACTCVKLWREYLIAGYGSGHIRLFLINTTENVTVSLMTEVAAHARWITSLDVALSKGYVLSVSEDSFVRVWEIQKINYTTLAQLYFTSIKDSFLVGGKFLNAMGTEFCISMYDSTLVYCYSVIK